MTRMCPKSSMYYEGWKAKIKRYLTIYRTRVMKSMTPLLSKDQRLDEIIQSLRSRHADDAQRMSRIKLAQSLYESLGSEDLERQSIETLVARVEWLQHLLNVWSDGEVIIQAFSPDRDQTGWSADNSVVVVVCPQMPFCTASVRGALQRFNIGIEWLTSCNVSVLVDGSAGVDERHVSLDRGTPISILYFEVEQQDLQTLNETVLPELSDVMREVDAVVSSFTLMQDKLKLARSMLLTTANANTEAAALLAWFAEGKATMLGYQYFAAEGETLVANSDALGLLQYPPHNSASQNAAPGGLRSAAGVIHFVKSPIRSRVHRWAYPDWVDVVVTDDQGACLGVHRFLILLTFAAYNQDPRDIPWLRLRIANLLERAGFDEREHEGRELLRVIELYPRDELFQSDLDSLLDTVTAINRIQERRQTRLFVRCDDLTGFANCLVYVPRDLYNTQLRERIQALLMNALGAIEAEFSTQFSESVLVRVHFVFRCDPSQWNPLMSRALEREVQQIAQGWMERLQERLRDLCGRKQASELMASYGQYFSLGYQGDFSPDLAADDVLLLSQLGPDQPLLPVLHIDREHRQRLNLRIYHLGDSLPLSDVMPVLESMGLRVLSERPHKVTTASKACLWIQDFRLEYRFALDLDIDQIKDQVQAAFLVIWRGIAELDSFNQLVIGAGLSWREVAVLRAYARYSKQILFTYSPEFMAATLSEHMDLAALLVRTFYAKFAPAQAHRWSSVSTQLGAEFDAALERVSNLGEDRVLRHYWSLLEATVRTNVFLHTDGDADACAYFAFKFRPSVIADMVKPVPYREIYVYSARVEGVHLRGGPVARGGLRWSDRSEDFRTEVLGLVKAQQVKNAVIVPVGAKGGFVARQVHTLMSREQRNAEGVACYKIFIRALLELTDNQQAGVIQRDDRLVAHDGDDPYLVVAADKGTATFSDTANAIAAEFGFWLADAFASGGSLGYDHKKMGITARGAWVSVQRHFHELGMDPQRDPIVTVGIGDMSGDVFGNGMLLSESLLLVAAFNHRHIFIDPNPDPLVSFKERERLFRESTQGWVDYNPTLISSGGGVFERTSKRIVLTDAIRTLLQIDDEALTPNELIHQLLKAKVDLLWNGGIGTYVKASTESHTDVGDKAGDALRIDGHELGAKVVGEGGNLGMTQAGRIEYCLGGGRCNTDFIDNAGGVDCSDHEVNIKIFLNTLIERGVMVDSVRVRKLESYTQAVARHVLHNNRSQTLALSLLAQDAPQRILEYKQLIAELNERGALDRDLEHLPSNDEISERRAQGLGLTRPELAVLLSASKSHLKRALHSNTLADEPTLKPWVARSFPRQLVEEFGAYLHQHPLYTAILATQLANDMVNRLGPNVFFRQMHATGATAEAFARSYVAALEVFNLEHLWSVLVKEGETVAPEHVYRALMQLTQLLKRSLRWFLRNSTSLGGLDQFVPRFKAGITELLQGDYLADTSAFGAQWRHHQLEWQSQYQNQNLINLLSHSEYAHVFPGLVSGAETLQCKVTKLAQCFFAVERRLELDVLTRALLATSVDSEWRVLARDAYLEQLVDIQHQLCREIMSIQMAAGGDIQDSLQSWILRHAAALKRWEEVVSQLKAVEAPDFAVYAVVLRELAELARAAQAQ